MSNDNISCRFKRNRLGSRVAKELIRREGTPEALHYFAFNNAALNDYDYWFFLSTLWISSVEHTSLSLWKRLFNSERPHRAECIMKPDELKAFNDLPDTLTAYRAHRSRERDWIAYTLNQEIAIRFAIVKHAQQITTYKIGKDQILALFLRRGESEIILLDKNQAIVTETAMLPTPTR